MTRDQQNQLTAMWAAYAAFYRLRLEDTVLKMYSEDLCDLEFEDVKAALSRYRKNPKNRQMPMPADIRALIIPEVDTDSAAREIAARVVGAVTKFGWCNGQSARAYMGEVGWAAVDRQGGWSHICENLGREISETTFYAQMRDLVKGQLIYSRSAMNAKIELEPGFATALFKGKNLNDL